jgi:hypothetical protein
MAEIVLLIMLILFNANNKQLFKTAILTFILPI